MTPASTRDHLVATAEALLDADGLEALTLREVARRAGVSHGAPLRHFDSLAALCSVIAARAFDGLYAAVAAARDEVGDDPMARLRASGQAYVRFAVTHPGPYRLMFRPDRCDTEDPALQSAGAAAFAQLLAGVSEAQAAGWHPAAHTADLAGVIWATVHGIASLALTGSLPGAVAANGGDPDLVRLTGLAQELLTTDPSVPTPGGSP